jgi:hypothetical protein
MVTNLRKHLALRVPELIVHGWDHLCTVWNKITLGEERIRRAANISTVQNLQSRAPCGSVVNRNYIAQDGKLNPNRAEKNDRYFDFEQLKLCVHIDISYNVIYVYEWVLILI